MVLWAVLWSCLLSHSKILKSWRTFTLFSPEEIYWLWITCVQQDYFSWLVLWSIQQFTCHWKWNAQAQARMVPSETKCEFYYSCVHWDWGREWALLSYKIVIDIVKGTCEAIMDPHADAQMDCIYFEVCTCMGYGFADIVKHKYLHPHLHLNPHRWFHMLDSKALLADSQWWYIQWPWPIRI